MTERARYFLSTWLPVGIAAAFFAAVPLGWYVWHTSTPDPRAYLHRQVPLNLLRENVACLADQLRQYHQAHGRYPGNDEGLAALDTFEARFPITLAAADGPHRPPDQVMGLRSLLRPSEGRADRLADFQNRHHRGPRNAEELAQTLDLQWEAPSPDERPLALEVALTRDHRLFLIDGPSLLAPDGLPYVYENRRAPGPEAFAASPADDADTERYAARVDDGIFVYTMGGQLRAEQLNELDRQAAWAWWLALPCFAVAAVLAVMLLWMRCWKLLLTGAVGASAATVVSAGLIGGVTCYVMSPPFDGRRDAQLALRQRELLEKHRAAGVIGEDAYRRVLQTLDRQ